MYHPTRHTGADAIKVERARGLRRNMTREEQALWQKLRRLRAQGFTFRRQQIIAGFIVDFYCYQAGLVIAVDGGVHAHQVEYDQERDTIIVAHGLTILRIPNEDVRDRLPDVLRRVIACCAAQPPTNPTDG